MFATKTERVILGLLVAAIGTAFQIGVHQTEWTVEKSGSKIMAAGTYITKDELEKQYLRKDFVADHYLRKQDIDKVYVPIAKFKDLESINTDLKKKADLVDSALKTASRQLTTKQVWHPKNPEFYLGFVDYFEGVQGTLATIQVSFVDSQPFQYNLSKLDSPKNFKFEYNGVTYDLTTTLKKRKGEIIIEANLRQSSPEDSSARQPTNRDA